MYIFDRKRRNYNRRWMTNLGVRNIDYLTFEICQSTKKTSLLECQNNEGGRYLVTTKKLSAINVGVII